MRTNRIVRRSSWTAVPPKNNESWCGQGINVIADEQTVV